MREAMPASNIGVQMEGVSMLELSVCRKRCLLPGSISGYRNVPGLDSVGAVTRIIAHISHDLRQPLTAILANAEFLTQPDIGQTQRETFYEEIRTSIDRMDELVSSLVEWSRGGDTLRPAVRDIVDTVGRAIRMVGVQREFRPIKIVHRHEGRAVGWFDANRLERAVANLVLNACEAVASSPGHIVISTNGNRSSLQIDVRDNGPGIPASIRDSLFEPFVSYGKAAGSGLGLAIAKKIVEDHGGKIYLDRRIENGTLITISLPFAIPKTQSSRERTTGPGGQDGRFA
jgi:signal transduction histidine kinase